MKAKGRKKSLVGWTWSNNEMHHEPSEFSELYIPPIYKTKKGAYFHSGATQRNEYMFNFKKVRITIEQFPPKNKREER